MVSPSWSRNRTEKLQDCWRGWGAVTAKPPGGGGDRGCSQRAGRPWEISQDGAQTPDSPPLVPPTPGPHGSSQNPGPGKPHLILRGILRRAAQKSIQHRSSPGSPDGVTGAMHDGAQAAGYGWSPGQENPISTSEWISTQPVTPATTTQWAESLLCHRHSSVHVSRTPVMAVLSDTRPETPNAVCGLPEG